MNCPKCSTGNSENAKFCKGCGYDLRGILKPEPVSQPTGLQCSKCGAENAAHAKFCKVCGTPTAIAPPAPVPEPPPPPPSPAPVPPVLSAPELPNGVACYKCKTLNNPSAKFCKSCGVPNPASPPVSTPLPKAVEKDEPRKPLILWAGIAAGILAIAGGGAYWMFAGAAKPKTASVTSAPAALPKVSAVTTLPEAATTAASAPAVVTSATATPAAVAVAAPASAAVSGSANVAAPSPASAIAKPLPDEAKPVPTQAERDAREAARKKQVALEQAAKQKERDKANMNKANRTLDDLLK